MNKRVISSLCLLATALSLWAQAWEDSNPGKRDLAEGLQYQTEAQASVADGQTPLWLNANKYGLSSLDETNGYLRAGIFRPLNVDTLRRWGIGYGVDMVVPAGYTSDIIVQQAYGELRWLYGVLTVGSKEYPMELKNNQLSSGSQTLGINARPVPQVRVALPDYWVLPFGNGWLRMKGHIAYGRMTDDKWQKTFTNQQHQYAEDVLYHSKAGYLKIGNEDQFYPFSVELGLEMAAEFGGTAYQEQNDGTLIPVKGQGGLKGMKDAFIPGGSDSGEGVYENVSGDQLGSWMIRFNYEKDTWKVSLYGERFFEDHSGMLFVDYDGYDEGENWLNKKKRRYLVYDFKDMLVGFEFNKKYGTWFRDFVAEYLYTRYQSGPIYHDHTPNIADHIGGVDNYYNHYIYTGWQHWGQVIGNPLYRSPINNDDGTIYVKDNRFMAFHLGLSGQPYPRIGYRLLATWQEGLGTYEKPYTRKHHNVSAMAEVKYSLNHNWDVKAAFGMDTGYILGHNYGGQLTITKTGILHK